MVLEPRQPDSTVCALNHQFCYLFDKTSWVITVFFLILLQIGPLHFLFQGLSCDLRAPGASSGCMQFPACKSLVKSTWDLRSDSLRQESQPPYLLAVYTCADILSVFQSRGPSICEAGLILRFLGHHKDEQRIGLIVWAPSRVSVTLL